MKINVNQNLKAMNGETLMDNDGKGNAVEAILKTAIVNALLSPVQQETGIDKVKKYELAKRIYESDEIDLKAEEITLIKNRIGELFSPIIVGQVFEMLEK